MPVRTKPNSEIVDFMQQIELSMNVNSLVYDNLCVWPCIRMKIRELFSQSISASILQASIHESSLDIKQQKVLFEKQLESLKLSIHKNNKRLDCLFLSTPYIHRDEYDNKKYCTELDPVYEAIQASSYRVEKFVLDSDNQDYYHMDYSLDIATTIRHNILSLQNINPKRIENFLQLSNVVKKLTGNKLILNEDYFILMIKQIISAYECYKLLFKAMNPRTILFSCYYSENVMGLIWASRDLNIKTIDLQHGGQGNLHWMYSSWMSVPKDGYKLLPNYFFNWSVADADEINRWAAKTPQHTALVSGNLWLKKWLSSDNRNYYHYSSKEKKFVFETLSKYQKVILITANDIMPPFPEHLLQAMRENTKNWLWIIRLHPLQRKGIKYRKMREILAENNISNIDLDYANSLPLYILFQHIDKHLTYFSTAACESIAFHINTAVVSTIGFTDFSKLIKKGILIKAQTASEISRFIKQDTQNKMKKEQINYLFEQNPMGLTEIIQKILVEITNERSTVHSVN
ncbi:MAG: capsular biosynthesis protein [gamma proteobacterium symbiont of Taylorina sp.]|nr:capsular biosynthesis protein [gamma proteobacterium symbiont of Taylorina sp.]